MNQMPAEICFPGLDRCVCKNLVRTFEEVWLSYINLARVG